MRRPNTPPTIAALAAVSALAVAGCQTAQTVPGSAAGDGGAIHEGFAYRLARHQLVVEATVTKQRTVEVSDELAIDTGKDQFEFRESAATPHLVLVPETAQTYYFQPPSSAFSDQDFTITASDLGILASVNGSSTGKAGEALTSFAKIAGSVLPLVGLLGVEDKKATEVVDRHKNELGFDAAEARYAKTWLAGAEPAEAMMVNEEARARALWAELIRLEMQLGAAREDQVGILSDLASTDKKEQITFLKDKAAAVGDVVVFLDGRRTVVQAAFAARLAAFKEKKGIGVHTATVSYGTLFEFDEIPPWHAALGGQSDRSVRQAFECGPVSGSPSANAGSAGGALTLQPIGAPPATATPAAASADPFGWCATSGGKGYLKAKTLFEQSKILVTATPYAGETVRQLPTSRAGSGSRILYRRPVSMMVAIYAIRDAAPALDASTNQTEPRLSLVSRSELKVMHPASPVASIAIGSGAWSQNTLALTMDSTGTLTSAQQVEGAAVSGALKGAADAVPEVFGSAQTTLTSLGALATARRKLELDEIKDRVTLLQQEKAVVDNQVALDGANASADLVRRQTVLTQRLETAKARYALVNAKSDQELQDLKNAEAVLGQQRSLDQASATYDLQVRQAVLTEELKTLKEEVALQREQNVVESGADEKIADIDRQIRLLDAQVKLLAAEKRLEDAQKPPEEEEVEVER